MSVLRVYDPVECDAAGVPLDWERCRTCGGAGDVVAALPSMGGVPTSVGTKCAVCGGHGSLKAAALDCWQRTFSVDRLPVAVPREVRCEGCGHARSEGTWEGPAAALLGDSDFTVEEAVREWLDMQAWKREPVGRRVRHNVEHWSPCDEDCRHGGPARYGIPDSPEWDPLPERFVTEGVGALVRELEATVEASWRLVDVRPLGWPHDLRPGRLAVLCLRCAPRDLGGRNERGARVQPAGEG